MSDANGTDYRSTAGIALGEVRSVFLSGLAGIVRSAGVFSPGALEAVRRGAGQFYNEITTQSGRAGFEQARGLTASKIQLISDDQLELSIRLGDLSRRLFETCQVGLWRLYLRFITLLDVPGLEATDNPVGPEAITCGLGEMLAELGGTVPQRMERLHDLEEALARDLPPLYAELNELLVRHGIPQAPRPGTGTGTAASSEASFHGGGETAPQGNPLAALQRLVFDRLAPTANLTAGAPGIAMQFTGAGAGPGGFAFSESSPGLGQAQFEQLLARLDALQRPAGASLDLFGGEPPAAPAPLPSLTEGELGGTLGTAQAAAIDVLTLVFETVFDDPRLPDPVKQAIGRLQIPMVKAAMLDPDFFDDTDHPARALLDHMARAAIGLPRDAGPEHSVCDRVRQVALQVQSEFDRDVEVFDRHAAELETFVAQRNHTLQREAEAYLPAAEEQERRDLAAIDAYRAVNGLLTPDLPPAIAEFARNDWSRVLEAVHLERGAESPEWQTELTVLADLLWSVQPKQDPNARQRLGAMVAGLLRRINDGLSRIGLSTAARKPFLDACFALQTAALRGKPAPAAPAPAPTDKDAAIAFQPGLGPAGDDAALLEPQRVPLNLAGRLLEAIRLPHGAGLGHLKAATVKPGDWVEFMLPGGEVRCGRLCWTSPTLHAPLFYNTGWPGAVSLAPAILERQLRDGIASLVGNRSLFDAMAEKALRRIATPH